MGPPVLTFEGIHSSLCLWEDTNTESDGGITETNFPLWYAQCLRTEISISLNCEVRSTGKEINISLKSIGTIPLHANTICNWASTSQLTLNQHFGK